MIHALAVTIFYCLLYVGLFSLVILSGRVLAPGDGIQYYLPNFYLGRMFWNALFLSGSAVAADPQAMPPWKSIQMKYSKSMEPPKH